MGLTRFDVSNFDDFDGIPPSHDQALFRKLESSM